MHAALIAPGQTSSSALGALRLAPPFSQAAAASAAAVSPFGSSTLGLAAACVAWWATLACRLFLFELVFDGLSTCASRTRPEHPRRAVAGTTRRFLLRHAPCGALAAAVPPGAQAAPRAHARRAPPLLPANERRRRGNHAHGAASRGATRSRRDSPKLAPEPVYASYAAGARCENELPQPSSSTAPVARPPFTRDCPTGRRLRLCRCRPASKCQ